MQLTKNFKLSEFRCKCGKCNMSNEVFANVQNVANNLQVLRDALKTPIHINSAVRCKHHNQLVNGSPKSQHLLGKAVDIVTKKFSVNQIYDVVVKLREQNKVMFNGIGIYNTFLHLDLRDNKTEWNYKG